MNEIQYERELIGAIIKKPSILDHVTKVIDLRDIEDYASYRTYETCLSLFETSNQFRASEVMARMRIAGHIEECGGEVEVRRLLTDNIGNPSIHTFYTKKIKSAALRRRMHQMATQVADMANQEELSDEECLQKMNAILNEIGTKAKSNVRHIKEIYETYISDMNTMKPQKSPKTGITDIDVKITGIGSNRLITVAGRPGGGKTTFVVQALHNIGLQNVGPTFLFTMEMDEIEIAEKMISDLFSINYTHVQEKNFTDDQKNKLRTDDRISKSNMYVDDTPFIDFDHVASVCREHKRKHGELGAIGIDYLGLMNKHKAKGETTTEAIGRVTQGLKQLARELGCSIFMLAQMNRENEKNKGTPTMSDLRDSGNIEQDSDMVLFLHKLPEDKQDDPRYTKIQLVIAKGRKTGTGIVDLCFNGSLQRISSGVLRHTS